MAETLPDSARIVIVGGGVIGTALAWALDQLGCSDVLALERDRLGRGTSWHSAGNVINMHTDPLTVELFNASHRVIRELSGRHDRGWCQCGRVMLARNAVRLREFDEIAETLAGSGVESGMLATGAIHEKVPIFALDDVVDAIWSPATAGSTRMH